MAIKIKISALWALLLVAHLVIAQSNDPVGLHFREIYDTPLAYPTSTSVLQYDIIDRKMKWLDQSTFDLPTDLIRNHQLTDHLRVGNFWLSRTGTIDNGINIASGHIDLTPVLGRGFVRIQDGNALPGSIEGYDNLGARRWVIGLLDGNSRVRIFGDNNAEFAFSNDVYVGSSRVLVDGEGADNLGNHTATQNIALGTNWLSGDGTNEGLSIFSATDEFVINLGGIGINSTGGQINVDAGTSIYRFLDDGYMRFPGTTTDPQASGDLGYHTTDDRYKVRTTTGVEDLAYVSDIPVVPAPQTTTFPTTTTLINADTHWMIADMSSATENKILDLPDLANWSNRSITVKRTPDASGFTLTLVEGTGVQIEGLAALVIPAGNSFTLINDGTQIWITSSYE